MEQKPRSVALNSFYYGLLTAAASIVYTLVMYLAGLILNNWVNYLGLIILIAGMVWGTMEYRKNWLGGYITYGKSFTSCFLIGIFSGIIGAIFTFIFATWIYPDMAQELLARAQEKMMESSPNMSDEQMEMGLNWARKFMSPVAMSIMGLFYSVIFSAILALILSIFIKKEDKSLKQTVM